jgi:hypothetical protein
MFVISSDFDVPPFSLPDLDDNNSFAGYVEALEAEILKKLLGITFYNQLIDALDALPDSIWSSTTTYGNGDTIADTDGNVWTSLQAANLNHAVVEGAWWTLAESENKWLKLKYGADYEYTDEVYEWAGFNKMLIPYVYAMWLKDQYDAHTSNGIVVPDVENGMVISPSRRIAAGYNKFSDYAGKDYCQENSLYGYLVANVADFPEADEKFTEQGYMNAWNI